MKSSSFLVLLLAVLIGFLASGIPSQLGLFRSFDEFPPRKGFIPAFHSGVSYGFDISNVQNGSLKDQTFIVTGANVGLGYWTAYHLASKGGNVITPCRTLKKCQDAKKELDALLKKVQTPGAIECAILDLSSLKSVQQFADGFKKTHKKLHSLILNAAVMTTPFGFTEDGIEQQIGVNHFGHFLLTRELLPVLESTATESKPATIAVVSSSAHYRTYPEGVRLTLEELNDKSKYETLLAYGQSKLANVLFSQELSERVKSKNILVNAVHPGLVVTELARHLFDSFEQKGIPKVILNFFRGFVREQIMWSPEVASYTQLYAAIGDEVKEKKITGKYYHPIARENEPDAHARNSTLQKGLWKLTEEILKSKGH